ncbi:MAG: putative sugar O-methyltransferase [Thermoleophilaceae bacterium]|nr:putative sugar O-methyltransferase [Thermoleophilaceae bacterium]
MAEQTEFEMAVPEILAGRVDDELRAMIEDLAGAPPAYHPSSFWMHYARLNIEQLERSGMGNLKRTVGFNYFTWGPGRMADQLEALRRVSGLRTRWRARRGARSWAKALREGSWATRLDSSRAASYERDYAEFLYLLARVAQERDHLGLLARTDEPAFGNPLVIDVDGHRLSEDLCNSAIEVNAMFEPGPVPEAPRICELGAGYGRVAHLLLNGLPRARVAVIDIPPALYIAQTYLTTVLPDHRAFRYRPFERWEDVEREYERSEIAFFLPHQVELIPSDHFDLVVNISSLHEMTAEQVALWFAEIDRIAAGRFYSKQWIEHHNHFDSVTITRDDYPVPAQWRALFDRNCPVQPRFFEALYDVSGGVATR